MQSFLSLCTTKIIPTANDHQIANGASGFFYMHNGRPFLITNRHVVTGRDNFTNEKLDKKQGLIPDGITFQTGSVIKDQRENYIYTPLTIKKYQIKWKYNQPMWYEHRELNPIPDIAAFDLISIFKGADKNSFPCINNANHSQKITLAPANPVSVIGYPFGKAVANVLPIWVSGTVASEPKFNVDNIPAFYIDCRTNSGSSGSPVFLYSTQGSVQLDDEPTKQSDEVYSMKGKKGHIYGSFANPVHRFVGIYSGRINRNSDIGYVWRSELINQICSNGIQAFKRKAP